MVAQALGIAIIATFLLLVRVQQKKLRGYRGNAQKAARGERGQLQSIDERLSAREYWRRIALFFLTVLTLGALAAGIAVAMHNHMFGN
jgi:ABC-type Fe3+ transport system permease subunit